MLDVKAEIGKRVEARRKELQFSQGELADFLGVSRVTVTNIESGTNNTTHDTLYRICCALHLQPNDLFPPVKFIPFGTKTVTKTVKLPTKVKVQKHTLRKQGL